MKLVSWLGLGGRLAPLAGLASKFLGGGGMLWIVGLAFAGVLGWGAWNRYQLALAREDLAELRATVAETNQLRERAARLFVARNMINRAAADAKLGDAERRLDAALEAVNATPLPTFDCPPSGDVWSARVPGFAARLRALHAADAASSPGHAGPRVEAVPAAEAAEQ